MGRGLLRRSSVFLSDNAGFSNLKNTIAHLTPRVAADRNLASFDMAAILARSFLVQFTTRHRRGPTDKARLKRCPIYLPPIAFGSGPTAPVFMLRTVRPFESPTMRKYI